MSSEDEFHPDPFEKNTPYKKRARTRIISDSDDGSRSTQPEDPSAPGASTSLSDSDSIKHVLKKRTSALRSLDSEEDINGTRQTRDCQQRHCNDNSNNSSEPNLDSGIYVESSEMESESGESLESSGEEVEEEEDGDESSEEEEGDDDDEEEEDDEEGEWEDFPEGQEATEGTKVDAFDSDFSDGQSEKCPICLNRFLGQELGTPESCDHSFCLDCLQEWSKKVNTCPVDRQVFNLILVRRELEGRIIQRIPVGSTQAEDAEEEEVDEDNTYCEVCGRCDREDRLLLCDGCDLGYHCECLDPPMEWIPVEEWYCPNCAPNQLEDDLSPEMLEDFREMVRSRFRPGATLNRVIARTRASEAVRSRIQRRRQENRETASTQVNRAAQRATQRTPVRRRIKRRRKRRRRRRTTKKTVKDGKLKDSSSSKSKLGTRKTTTTKKRKTKTTRRRRRKTRKVRKTRRALAAGKPLFSPTVKKRIADRLGLEKPPPGHTIPLVRRQGGDRTLQALRSGVGIQSLRILGDRDELDSFDDSYGDDSLGEVAVQRPVPATDRSTVAAILRRKNVGTESVTSRIRIQSPPPTAVEPLDLLGSILENQALLHTQSKNLIIKRDGSLSLSSSTASVQQRPHGPSSSSSSNGSASSASVSPSSGHVSMKVDSDSSYRREPYTMNRTNCASFSGFASRQQDQPSLTFVSERLPCSPKRDLQKNEKSKENKSVQSDDDVDIYSDIESVGDGGIEDDVITPPVSVTFKCNPQEDNADDNSDDSSENELVIDEEAQPDDDEDDNESVSDKKTSSISDSYKTEDKTLQENSGLQNEKVDNIEDVSMDADEDIQYNVHNDDDLRSEIERMSGDGESEKLSEEDSNSSKDEAFSKKDLLSSQENNSCSSPVPIKPSKVQRSPSPFEPAADQTPEEESDKMSVGEESVRSDDESNSKISEPEEVTNTPGSRNGKESDAQNCDNVSEEENEGSLYGENISEDESSKVKSAEKDDELAVEDQKDSVKSSGEEASEEGGLEQECQEDEKLEAAGAYEQMSDSEMPNSEQDTPLKDQHSDISEDEEQEIKTPGQCQDITEHEESNGSIVNDPSNDDSQGNKESNLQSEDQETEKMEDDPVHTVNHDLVEKDATAKEIELPKDESVEDQEKAEDTELKTCPISPAADVEDVSDVGSEYADRDDMDTQSQCDPQDDQSIFEGKKINSAFSGPDNVESAVARLFKDSSESKQSTSKSISDSRSRSLDFKRSSSCKRSDGGGRSRHRDSPEGLEILDREEGEIVEEMPSRKHHKSVGRRSSHDHEDPDDFLDLAPRINISDLPRIPKKKRDGNKAIVMEEQEVDVKRTSVLARVDAGETSEVSWKKLSRHTRERSYRDRKPKDEKALFRERELKQKDKKDDPVKHGDSDRRRNDEKHRKATETEKWREKMEYDRQPEKSERDYERQREKKGDKHRDSGYEKAERTEKHREGEKSQKREHEKCDKHDKGEKQRDYEKCDRQRDYDKRDYDKTEKRDYGYEKSHEKKCEKSSSKDRHHKSSKDREKRKHSRDRNSPSGVEKTRERSKHKCPHARERLAEERSKDRDVRKVDEKLKVVVEKEGWKEKNDKHGEKRKSKREEKHQEGESHRCREHRRKEHSPSPFSDITSIESKEIYAKGDSIIINVSFNRSSKEEPLLKDPKNDDKEVKSLTKLDKVDDDLPTCIKEVSRKRPSPEVEIISPDPEVRLLKHHPENRLDAKRPKLDKIQVGERYWQEMEDDASADDDVIVCKHEEEHEENSQQHFDDGGDVVMSYSDNEGKSHVEDDNGRPSTPENPQTPPDEPKSSPIHANFASEANSPRREPSMPVRAPRSPPSPPSPRSPSPPSPPEDDSYDPCEPTRSPSPVKELGSNLVEMKPKPPPEPELPPLPPEPEPSAMPPDNKEFQCHAAIQRPVPVSASLNVPPSVTAASLNAHIQPALSAHHVKGNVPQSVISVPNIRVPPPNFVPQTSSRNPIGPGMPIVTGIRTLNWTVGAAPPHLLFTPTHMQPVLRGGFVTPQIPPGAPVGSQIGPLLPPPPAPLGILSQIRPPNISLHAALPSTPVMHGIPPPPPPPNLGITHQMAIPPSLNQPPPSVVSLAVSGHVTHPTPSTTGTTSALPAISSSQTLSLPSSHSHAVENSHSKLQPSQQDVTEVIDMDVDSPYTPGDSPLFNSMSDEPSPPQKPPSPAPAPKDIFDTLLPASNIKEKQHDGKVTSRSKMSSSSIAQSGSVRSNERANVPNKELAAKKSRLDAKTDASKKKHVVKFEVSSKQKASSAGRKEVKASDKKEISVKLDEDELKILDELPSSAVEMQVKEKFLKKLNRQERVVEEVKLVLKPYYSKRELNKEEYKDILRKSVPKICHSKSGEINPVKIKTLIEGYVRKVKYHRKKAMKMQKGGKTS